MEKHFGLTPPPMSEPTPEGLPFRAIRAPSPPNEPQKVGERLCGPAVLPKMLLEVSGHWSSWPNKDEFNSPRTAQTYHQYECLWYVQPYERNSPAISQDVDKYCVLFRIVSDPGDIARRCFWTFRALLILERDG
ncbi:hypothetical protein PAXRUDRAFT_422530 [Paxillus rubicundulus Ve08.2h10]|uniref:Uncharacterized protein n=1 Tax=Paxillus rubicundulus Ve08.2h10 TaxID=930991 RepID=A0A0D0E2J0_9AGAM|nr:hypothetical protein PAXRUDRAFT_422530 [Paxillus rubicundulus Ve08.2h10]